MRLWSIHPRHLDRQGLTACWREALLAQAVLADRTRGYRAHSQLVRFRRQPDPVSSIGAYLLAVADEATARGYRFDVGRIDRPARPVADEPGTDDGDPGPARGEPVTADGVPRIPVTDGQVTLEWEHLRRKLARRSPDRLAALAGAAVPAVHPLFRTVPGAVEEWERAI